MGRWAGWTGKSMGEDVPVEPLHGGLDTVQSFQSGIPGHFARSD